MLKYQIYMTSHHRISNGEGMSTDFLEIFHPPKKNKSLFQIFVGGGWVTFALWAK